MANCDICTVVIVLIGYMGCGKSTVGKQLAKAMGIPFVDLDAHMEKVEKMSIASIFDTKGEIYFRKKEATLLLELLDAKDPMILALGGGTPCYGNVMQELLSNANVITIYLQCSVELLTQRLWKEKETRPLIAHIATQEALNEFIRKHLFERSPFYMMASIKLHTNSRSQKELVEQILFALL